MRQINLYSFAEKTPMHGSKVFVIDKGYSENTIVKCRVEGIVENLDPKDGLPIGSAFIYIGQELKENQRLVILVGGADYQKNPNVYWFDAEDIEADE